MRSNLDRFLDRFVKMLLEQGTGTSSVGGKSVSSLKLKHAEDPDSDFDSQQLRIGIEVEKEHTDDEDVAKAIAKAHLKEHPRYYSFLLKMEKMMKNNKGY